MSAAPLPRFACDMAAEGMLKVRTIRSPVAKGRVLSVSHPGLPHGYSLILASDIPGKRRVSVMGADIPVLAWEAVSYPGEPVALLTGPDALELEALARDVKVECEEEWPLFSFESFSSDQILHERKISSGDAEAALADCPVKLERTYRTGSQEHYYPEPLAALASLEYDKMVVRTATQWPFHARSAVAAVLDVEESDVVVRPTETGAHLDGKLWYPSILAAQAALACIVTKRPVLLALDREEDFRFSPKRYRTAVSLRAGADRDGALRSLDAQVLVDSGAYGAMAEEILERLCCGLPGPYACPNVRIEAYAVQTNTVPLGPFAGMGMASASFAVESLMAEIALAVEADPVEIRRRNLPGPPERAARGEKRPRARASLDAIWPVLSDASDFPRKYSAFELFRKRGGDRSDGALRGIGFAFGYQGNGFLLGKGADEAAVECVLGKDLRLLVRTGAVLSNPGTALIWKRIASGILGIDEEAVDVEPCSTEASLDSGPSTLSRNATVVASLVGKCAEAIQRSRFRAPLPIAVRKAYKPRKRPADGPRGPEAFASPSFGAAVVEIELDQDTAEPRVSGAWMAIDSGEIISMEGATFALDSGASAALAWASSERMEFADGRVGPHIFWRYAIPRADESPHVECFFPGPAEGAAPRGLGELPFILLPAAYARAVAQATGFPSDSIPLGRDRMIEEELGA